MGKLSGFTYKEIIKKLTALGFAFYRQAKGSHEIWYNEKTDMYTTVVKHGGDIAEGTLKNIIKQGGIETEDFLSRK